MTKVYCENCINYMDNAYFLKKKEHSMFSYQENNCLIKRSSPEKKEAYNSNCIKKNIKNDCKDFKDCTEQLAKVKKQAEFAEIDKKIEELRDDVNKYIPINPTGEHELYTGLAYYDEIVPLDERIDSLEIVGTCLIDKIERINKFNNYIMWLLVFYAVLCIFNIIFIITK